jgi:ABC-2 type transport system permease protein
MSAPTVSRARCTPNDSARCSFGLARVISASRGAVRIPFPTLAIVVLLVVYGVTPQIDWLQVPLLVAFLVVLATGFAMLLSSLYIRFRDIAQVWQLSIQLLLFGSAVFYVITQFPSDVQRAMVVNPLAMVFTQMRHALIDPSAPTAAEVAGGSVWLLVPIAVTAGVCAIGLWVFRRESPLMAENL